MKVAHSTACKLLLPKNRMQSGGWVVKAANVHQVPPRVVQRPARGPAHLQSWRGQRGQMPSAVARAPPAYREHPREKALTGAWQDREHGAWAGTLAVRGVDGMTESHDFMDTHGLLRRGRRAVSCYHCAKSHLTPGPEPKNEIHFKSHFKRHTQCK